MASEDDSKRKCFTFIWQLENASYCWQKYPESIHSPSFTVDEIHETNWKLELYPFFDKNDAIGFFLRRLADNYAGSVQIDCELASLSSDGTVLHTFKRKKLEIGSAGITGGSVARKKVFPTISKHSLTIRCRIWESFVEMPKQVQCFARTRITVEKRSFMWSTENFSSLKSLEKRTCEIKSHDNSKKFMSLELFSTGGLICDETIRFKIIPNYQDMKMSTFQLSVVDASKNAVKCFQDEFWASDTYDSKDFTLFCTKSELMEKKSVYLPNDVLSLWCECVFAFGTVQEEIEKIDSDCIAVVKKKPDYRSFHKEDEFSVPKCILVDDLKSMLNNSDVSDINIRTKNQTYPAHTFILSARSPVFKAMFSNDMKEKINECVDIEDLNDDTVSRLLRYIYSAEVEELNWVSAANLYEAADKYEILSLKDLCSSYLMSNLCENNACEALVLADLHQDEDLKGFVQNFILKHVGVIINSEEWKQLEETNLKLVYETTCLKFKKHLK
ncbi:unnamed protein product [Larinioides sclopetarius]|uniref:Speckle-type POZ protein n=1 Tax=Larinioides sclopetarius TaxID=280406 RepID=A0AAV1YTC2_9ARAC